MPLEAEHLVCTMKILHLGDLHAGGDNDNGIKEALYDFLNGMDGVFNIVVLNGDIVDKADDKSPTIEEKYLEAEQFMKNLKKIPCCENSSKVLVPGWHDFQNEQDDPFVHYINFINKLNDGIHVPLSPKCKSSDIIRHFRFTGHSCDYSIHLFALNSCDPEMWDKTAHKTYRHGNISERQVQLVASLLGKEEIEKSFTILVFHHTPWGKDIDGAKDTPGAGTALLNQVKLLKPSLCLTGHWHARLEGKEHNNGWYFTAGQICWRENNGQHNQFNIIELNLFRHDKNVFLIKQRPVIWKDNKWSEKKDEEGFLKLLCFSNGCSDKDVIKQYAGY